MTFASLEYDADHYFMAGFSYQVRQQISNGLSLIIIPKRRKVWRIRPSCKFLLLPHQANDIAGIGIILIFKGVIEIICRYSYVFQNILL